MSTSLAADVDLSAVDEWMARGGDEDVLWSGRPRTTSALPAIAVGVVLVVAGVVGGATQTQLAVALVLATLVPIGLLVAVWGYLGVVRTRYVVTDRALYRRTGVLSRRVQRVSLGRVQNSAFTQGVLGTVFDYGTVSVEAAGGGAIAFADIDDPREVRALVEKQVGGGELPGTLAQWQAVRDEVRALRGAFEQRGG
ncbi:PH domain-containing protein [Halogranum gelatinilyticum]|uniref:PH domain-containing protein n=1 Tax=Halogranum gelatinilyticum TaxID=660521 RepID=A0A1G9ZDL0_9EURY|nr:PH domain-containing protein [Halogranum gelatinilyticum]SDN19530.1 PH domain-containing protein [Halogranum gelatinilyticum]